MAVVTKWERFGDDTWINVDHVEVLRVEEQEDGRWQLMAAFASGRSYPIGSHDDREMLAECTDAVLRGRVGERLLDLAAGADEVAPVIPEPAATQPAAEGVGLGAVASVPVGSSPVIGANKAPRKWRFWRSAPAAGATVMEPGAGVGPLPAA